jgi:hypothetical protein
MTRCMGQAHFEILYVDYTDDGANLYDLVCYLDLEGIVMKQGKAPAVNRGSK